MDAFSLEVISMTEFLSQGENGLSLIPDVPAIYLWTVDLTRLVRMKPEAARAELLRLLRLPIRSFHGRATPYYMAEITDLPTPLTDDRETKMFDLLAGGGP